MFTHKPINILFFLILLLVGLLSSCKIVVNTVSNDVEVQLISRSLNEFSPTLRNTQNDGQYQGSILFIEERGQPNFRIAEIDLETQDVSTVFQIEKGAWAYQIDTFEDQLVMSYTDKGNYDRSGIYLLNLLSSDEPELVIGSEKALRYYYDPIFSLDGSYVYYIVSDTTENTLRLERIKLETKEVEVVAQNALWPKLSPDGEGLVYLTINPETQARSLVRSEVDGSQPEVLIEEGMLSDIDLPFFSADGEWVYVSVPEEQTTSFWQGLNGLVGIAYAHGNHDVPSQWWRVRVSGGGLEQTTNQSFLHYYGEANTNGTIAFTGTRGLYLVNGEGTDLVLSSRALRAFTWYN